MRLQGRRFVGRRQSAGEAKTVNAMAKQDMKAAGEGGSVWSRVVVESGRIFFGALDKLFYCLDTRGNLLWTFRTGDRITASSVASKGRIYFCSMDGHIYALTFDGKELWKYRTGDSMYSSPVVYDDVVYCASMDGYVYALSCADGKLVWKFHVGSEIGTGIGILNGRVVFGACSGTVYCLGLDGKMLWDYKAGEEFQNYGGPLWIHEGVLFISNTNRYLYAIDSNGNVKWKYFLNDYPILTTYRDTLYAALSNGELLAFSLSGKVLWTYKFPTKASAVVSDGKALYASCENGDFYSLSFNGTLLRKEYLNIGDFVVWPVVHNGIIYGGGDLCYFYALDPKDLGILWKFATSNPVRSEWRMVGFAPEKEEERKKKYYGRPTLVSEKMAYVDGKAVVQEQKFSEAYSSGATTYFKTGVYEQGSGPSGYQMGRKRAER